MKRFGLEKTNNFRVVQSAVRHNIAQENHSDHFDFTLQCLWSGIHGASF